jgi:putative sporulation protein YyaC
MTYYYDSARNRSVYLMCKKLKEMIDNIILPGQKIVIMCIGSDRSTGDCLGPLVGYKLSGRTPENVFVYGSLEHPIHAVNLTEAIENIYSAHKSALVIAVDASLGKREHIGFATLSYGPLKPGLGVKKKLPEVGDIHITGIVNCSGVMDSVLLQTTRLSTIMVLADTITTVFLNTFNASPYTQQEPVRLWQSPLSS